MFKRLLFPLLLVLGLGAACGQGAVEPALTPIPSSTATEAPEPSPTFTPPPTHTSTPTLTPSITPTPTWAWHPPGEVVAPILLYHHVDYENNSERYNVTPERFAEQMQALDDWGYTAITITQLIKAITEGTELPPRPVVITFDDGHISVYENAFPIMLDHGFPGVTYVVANRLKAEGFTGVEELVEMASAGWEVGSHSYTHTNLGEDTSVVRYEVLQSKLDLEDALSFPINTFAYPFGGFKPLVGDKVLRYGYLGGVGLGKNWTHNSDSLFFLQRIEVNGAYDLETFASLLPWSDLP